MLDNSGKTAGISVWTLLNSRVRRTTRSATISGSDERRASTAVERRCALRQWLSDAAVTRRTRDFSLPENSLRIRLCFLLCNGNSAYVADLRCERTRRTSSPRGCEILGRLQVLAYKLVGIELSSPSTGFVPSPSPQSLP